MIDCLGAVFSRFYFEGLGISWSISESAQLDDFFLYPKTVGEARWHWWCALACWLELVDCKTISAFTKCNHCSNWGGYSIQPCESATIDFPIRIMNWSLTEGPNITRFISKPIYLALEYKLSTNPRGTRGTKYAMILLFLNDFFGCLVSR